METQLKWHFNHNHIFFLFGNALRDNTYADKDISFNFIFFSKHNSRKVIVLTSFYIMLSLYQKLFVFIKLFN